MNWSQLRRLRTNSKTYVHVLVRSVAGDSTDCHRICNKSASFQEQFEESFVLQVLSDIGMNSNIILDMY